MAQFGFFFDQSRCVDCRACVLSCRDWNDTAPGPVKWCRVFQWEKGAFPNLRLHFLFAPCYHCEDPVCVRACESKAIYKDETYGAVLVDEAKCQGSRRCSKACPYGAPQYQSRQPGAKMSKCNMCVDRLRQGELPVCVQSCPMRALDFGPLEDLKRRYGTLQVLEGLPRPTIAKPAVVFKAHVPKRNLVDYDGDKAVELLRKRDIFANLPPLYSSREDVGAQTGTLARDRLVLKPKTEEEARRALQHDE